MMSKNKAYEPYETKLFEDPEVTEEFKKAYANAHYAEVERQTQRKERQQKIKSWLMYIYKVAVFAVIITFFLLLYDRSNDKYQKEADQIIEQAKAEKAQIDAEKVQVEQEIAKLKNELAGLKTLPKPVSSSANVGAELSNIDEDTLNSYQSTLIETSREMSGYVLAVRNVEFKSTNWYVVKDNRRQYQYLTIKFQWLLDYLYNIEKRHGAASRSAIVTKYVEFVPLRQFDAKVGDGSVAATTKYFNDILILLTNQNVTSKEVRTLFNQAFLPIIATDFANESDASVTAILENLKSNFQGITN